jgi:hypothetical protein
MTKEGHDVFDETDPDLLWFLISRLLDGWEGALHSRDSAAQVAQAVPDWKARYDKALSDENRIEHTRSRFGAVRKLFDDLSQGQVNRSEVDKVLAEFQRKPS